jgi:spermidine synthase
MLVPATFMGVVLPLGMRLLVDDLARSGRQVGLAYLANTGGSVAGALLAGFALIPLLGLKHALLLLAAAQVGLGGAFLGHLALPPPRRRQVRAASAALLAVAAGGAAWLLSGPSPFDLQNLRGSSRPVIHAHRDAVGSSVSVVSAHAGEKMLRIDGVNAALEGARAGYMPMMAHIPLLLHPDPRRLLVICFGTGSTAGAGLLHDGTTIDVVDINPVVFDFAPHFVRWNHGVAHDPRARLIVDDGRNYLLTSRERYDVITSEPMPPRFAGVVNLYSREYYLLARERLRPGGLMVQWVPFHLVSVAEGLQILRSVREVFPHTTLWLHGYTGIVVARRDGQIAVDLPRVRRALASPGLREDLAAFGVGDALAFAGLHALGPDAIARAVAAQPPITDDRPSLEFHPPTSRAQEMRQIPGSDLMFTREMSRSVEIVHRLRLAEEAPLAGATPAEASAVARARARESHETLGRLYALWGQQAAAAAELEAAARLAAPAGGGAR